MPGLGLVLGSGARDLELPGEAVVVNRHGDAGYALPHQLDHAANLRKLVEAGCDRVLGVGSVGSLRREIAPGTLVCPDDFVALDVEVVTTRDGFDAHRVPGFDREWRERVLAALAGVADVRDGGVYWQVRGPRLETPAEVRFVANYAELIGMTLGSECVIAGELGLPYTALCMVDNWANGIKPDLTVADVAAGQAAHRESLREALTRATPGLTS